MEFGKAIPYDIKVTSSDNKGFIVKVGCATLVFTDQKDLVKFIDKYTSNPKEIEKVYNRIYAPDREISLDQGYNGGLEDRPSPNPIQEGEARPYQGEGTDRR